MNYLELRKSPKSYEGDFNYENGNYINNCVVCNCNFVGYKNRFICNECSRPVEYEVIDELTEERFIEVYGQLKINKDNGE